MFSLAPTAASSLAWFDAMRTCGAARPGIPRYGVAALTQGPCQTRHAATAHAHPSPHSPNRSRGRVGRSRARHSRHTLSPSSAGSDDDEDSAHDSATACTECHGDDGASIAGANIGDDESLSAYADNELASLIVNGIPNTTMLPSTLEEEQIEAVVSRSCASSRATATSHESTATSNAARRDSRARATARRCHRSRNAARVAALEPIGGARRVAEQIRCSIRARKCGRRIASIES